MNKLNKPITYKHLFSVISLLVLAVIIFLIGRQIYTTEYDSIYNRGFIEGNDKGYKKGYEQATDDIKIQEEWYKNCSMKEQKEYVQKHPNAIILEKCPNP